jgi:hypothetical protein
MYIFVARCQTFFDISGILLTAKNRYDSEGHEDLDTEIARMQCDFECIEEASSENSIVRIEHVNNIKSGVFYARVLRGAK